MRIISTTDIFQMCLLETSENVIFWLDLIIFVIYQFLLACGLQCVIVTKDLMRWVRDGATPRILMETDSEEEEDDVAMTNVDVEMTV